MRRRPGQPRDFLHDLLDVDRDRQADGAVAVALEPGVLVGDRDADLAGQRIMRADDRADAVLERRDDPAAVGVVLGVGREDHADVEVQPDRVAADLHVALFEHVEQADLDLGGEVGQLVDAEDAAVGARDQAEVHGQFAREIAALGVLDHVDLADQVGDGHVGRGELFVIAVVAADPVDRRRVALGGDQVAGILGDGCERIVVDLGAGDDRDGVVEQVDELAEHPRLGLAAQAEEEHVVLGEDRVADLRDHRLFVAEDAGKQRLARLELGDQVAPHLVLDRLDPIPARLQLAQGPGPVLRHHCACLSMWNRSA